MAQPFTKEDLTRAEAIVQQLHGLKGYDAWAECIAKAMASERQRCADIARAIDSGRGNEGLIAAAILSEPLGEIGDSRRSVR